MIRMLAIAAAACGLALAAPATAATVTATQSVGFMFDFSGVGDVTLRSHRYTCGGSVVAVCVGDEQLAPGGQYAIDLGTTAGGADLHTQIITNIFSVPIDDLVGSLIPNLAIPAALDALFVTVRHINENFEVDTFELFSDETPTVRFIGVGPTVIEVAAVPLPAPIALMGGALAALGFAARRRSTRLA